METILIVYCAIAAVILAGLLTAVVLRVLHVGRRKRRDAELARQYLRIVVRALMDNEGEVPLFPRLYCYGGRLVLAETLARLSSATYGLDTSILRRIVELNELETYLLRRARRTRGYRRAWFLALLSRIPIGEDTVWQVLRYSRDRNRSVRFYALMVQLAQDPSVALRRMADYPDIFSAFELTEIVALLRRGGLRVSHMPLLTAPERNLRSLGLCIVRQFGVEEAELALLHIAESDESPELGREAIYTLCALQRPLAHREVVLRVTALNAAERKALLRYMALEGYSGSALEGVFNREEGPYFEALLNSYKRTLVWS